MPINQFAISPHALSYLRNCGYTVDTSMDSFIQTWWSWYAGENNFYKVPYIDQNNHKHTRERLSLHPARRCAREWASLLLNEDTTISVDAPRANDWLNAFLDCSDFWPNGQTLIEKAFALGTSAWALSFEVGESQTNIRIRRYDARMIIPLSWDDDGVTECAFCTRVSVRGKTYEQLLIHSLDQDTNQYVIQTVIFDKGEIINPETMGFLAEYETHCPSPTFAVIRPGIENICVDLSPFGMSVFADAVDVIKSVDLCWDAFMQEVDLTEVKVFMDESMIDIRTADGKRVPIPKADNNRIFRKLLGQSGSDLYEVFSPEIRAEPLRTALNAALSMYGDQTGFGQNYFVLDKNGGLKTATEVHSDNSALTRNIKKHERQIRNAIQTIVTALLVCAKANCGVDIEEDFGAVQVMFDDSIITDTQTDKNMMLSEVNSGLVPKWMYLTKFYGLSEEEAQALIPSEEVIDIGF